MTGFVVLWLSHNSIISFVLVMGVWGCRLGGGGGGGGGVGGGGGGIVNEI